MSAPEAVQMLIDDHEAFKEDFAKDAPCKSLLQRQGMTLDSMLDMFNWQSDDDAWVAEYDKGGDAEIEKLIRYRRRVYFDVGGWRDINEDFGRGDVSCLRDIRVPFVTSRSPLQAMKDEFNG